MTKKEFKKKCEQEKTSSYKLILTASIITSFAFIIVLIALLAFENIETQITISIIGGIFAIIGIVLDIIGQIKITKEYQEYIRINQWKILKK